MGYESYEERMRLDAEETDAIKDKRITELEEQLDAVRWRPIETAPREGIHIRGLWVKTLTGWNWQQFMGVLDECGDFIEPEGDYNFGWDSDDYTHWMPLPEPPKALQGEKE